MKLKTSPFLFVFVASLFLASPAHADSNASSVTPFDESLPNVMDELDPFDPNIEQKLREYDLEQESATGKPSWIGNEFTIFSDCYRATCKIWARVVKSEQKLYLYVDGNLAAEWLVSSGVKGHTTPDFDRHPNGRIYDRYSSKKFPGGDYNGLGNMPYAVFISGGFAIHGTPQGNWSKLGKPASHGCIRVHPDNAYTFNGLVRKFGIANTWITVQ